eukprot:Nk52_evm37s210 gene=Nk52_evmTU37s210
MRVSSICEGPQSPCFLLTYRHVTLMVDCALNASGWAAARGAGAGVVRVPHLQALADSPAQGGCAGMISSVDAVLISNHDTILALPFLTEQYGFKGDIYATEPSLQLGKLLMEELYDFLSVHTASSTVGRSTDMDGAGLNGNSKLEPQFSSSSASSTALQHLWANIYSLCDIEQALQRVQMVSYGQQLNLFNILTVTPHSSGYCIGSCNWTIATPFSKISILSASSSGSSRHPLPLDVDALRDSEVLLVTGVATEPLRTPQQQFQEMCAHIATTLHQGGQVLIPCYPTGVIYDLLEYIHSHLSAQEGLLGMVPMVFVSEVAQASLAYANIFAEWLCTGKQERVYQPSPPFQHQDLIQAGLLKVFPSVGGSLECSQIIRNGSIPSSSAVASPNSPRCVIFCGHPSMESGDVVEILSSAWASNPLNCLICIDPDVDYTSALRPFASTLHARVYYTPIDLRLNFQEVNSLIREFKPKHLVVPDSYLQGCVPTNYRSEMNMASGTNGSINMTALAGGSGHSMHEDSSKVAKPTATILNAIVETDVEQMSIHPIQMINTNARGRVMPGFSYYGGSGNSGSGIGGVRYTTVPDCDCKYERAILSESLADALEAVPVGVRMSATSVQASLHERNNMKYLVMQTEEEYANNSLVRNYEKDRGIRFESSVSPCVHKTVLGHVRVEDIVDRLIEAGLGSRVSVSCGGALSEGVSETTASLGSTQAPSETAGANSASHAPTYASAVAGGWGGSGPNDQGGNVGKITTISIKDGNGCVVGKIELLAANRRGDAAHSADAENSVVVSVNQSENASTLGSPRSTGANDTRVGAVGAAEKLMKAQSASSLSATCTLNDLNTVAEDTNIHIVTAGHDKQLRKTLTRCVIDSALVV